MRIILLFGLVMSTIQLSAQVEPDYVLISDGWVDPVALVNAGDGTGRLFVVEKQGLIWVMDDPGTGSYLPVPFLDIKSKVTNGGERGLLGLAFHPDYPAEPYFYVNYTTTQGSDLYTRIERYTVISDPNRAMTASAKLILEFSQPYDNHNGGDLAFGPDGYLYIASGDGGGARDPMGFTQNYTNLLGALLRVDVDRDDFAEEDKNYGIPADNPYVNTTGFRPELWSIGLRNPWRISFDTDNGDLYIADVGQNLWEEVNRQLASSNGGEHYGWSCREGANDVDFNPCTTANTVDPIFEYNHSEGLSITGGHVYRGEVFPAFQGKYFCTDYIAKSLWLVNPETGESDKYTLPEDYGRVSTFGRSESGELFVATISASGSNDKIYRIINRAVCPDRILVDVINQVKYVAETTIESTASLTDMDNVTMVAGEEVLLQPAFSVENPASLEVMMQSCIQQLVEQD